MSLGMNQPTNGFTEVRFTPTPAVTDVAVERRSLFSDAAVPAVEVKGLRKTYRRGAVEAVRGIDLNIPRGVCFGLLGPNGAGKSTTIEILQGLIEPTAGSVRVFGLSYAESEREIRTRIAGVLQESHFYGRTRVRELIELFASLYPEPRPIEDIAQLLKLNEFLDRFIVNLSGGQRQRAFLACALVGEPELIFLDEPTTGLDPSARRDFWEVIGELKRRKKTILLSTHYMEEAEVLADQLAIIDAGVIIEQGTPVEIIERVMRGRDIPARPRRATLDDVFLTLTGRSLEFQAPDSGAAK